MIGRLSGTGQEADAEQGRGPQENFFHLEIP